MSLRIIALFSVMLLVSVLTYSQSNISNFTVTETIGNIDTTTVDDTLVTYTVKFELSELSEISSIRIIAGGEKDDDQGGDYSYTINFWDGDYILIDRKSQFIKAEIVLGSYVKTPFFAEISNQSLFKFWRITTAGHDGVINTPIYYEIN